ELMLFRDWYLPCHLRRTPSTAEAAALDTVFDALLDNALAQPRVYVHRDYMPRNLMLSVPLPGIIDFQDAMYGPVTYDIACLFRDAFISWPEQRVHGWLRAYWQRARQAGVPVADAFETFQQQTDLMGVQRHLKVLGIFARIAHRDGKPRYLADAPRFVAYIEPLLQRYPQLQPLAPWLTGRQPSCAP